MVLRILRFLFGASLAAGGGYVVWRFRRDAAAFFPFDPATFPWFLAAGMALLVLGMVMVVSALLPSAGARARAAEREARRRQRLIEADQFYKQRALGAPTPAHALPPPADPPAETAPAAARGPFEDPLFSPAAPASAAIPLVFRADGAQPIPAGLERPPPLPPSPMTDARRPAAAPAPPAAPRPAAGPTGPANGRDLSSEPAPPAPGAGALAAIRQAIAANELAEADRLLAMERTRLTSGGDAHALALAELTGLAGDHAAAAGRVGGAKWLWRLSLQRFAAADAIASPEARAVSERLRLADG